MRKRMQNFFKVVGIFFAVSMTLAVSLQAHASWLEDVLKEKAAIELFLHELHLDDGGWHVSEVLESEENDPLLERTYRNVTLEGSPVGPIRLTLSFPGDFNPQVDRRPVLFVLAGFQTGRESAHFIDQPENNIVVSMDYPFPAQPALRDFQNLPKALYKTPGQAAVTLKWLENQAWVDKERINLMGVSLGSLLFPTSLRLAEHQGFRARSMILAYGGADAATFIKANQTNLDRRALSYLVIAGRTLLAPLDPIYHLPHLQTPLCLINGSDDKVIPRAAVEKLHQAAPEPKTILWIDGPHINVDTFEILQQLNEKARIWLKEQQAID